MLHIALNKQQIDTIFPTLDKYQLNAVISQGTHNPKLDSDDITNITNCLVEFFSRIDSGEITKYEAEKTLLSVRNFTKLSILNESLGLQVLKFMNPENLHNIKKYDVPKSHIEYINGLPFDIKVRLTKTFWNDYITRTKTKSVWDGKYKECNFAVRYVKTFNDKEHIKGAYTMYEISYNDVSVESHYNKNILFFNDFATASNAKIAIDAHLKKCSEIYDVYKFENNLTNVKDVYAYFQPKIQTSSEANRVSFYDEYDDDEFYEASEDVLEIIDICDSVNIVGSYDDIKIYQSQVCISTDLTAVLPHIVLYNSTEIHPKIMYPIQQLKEYVAKDEADGCAKIPMLLELANKRGNKLYEIHYSFYMGFTINIFTKNKELLSCYKKNNLGRKITFETAEKYLQQH
jgi:hypothetical protein